MNDNSSLFPFPGASSEDDSEQIIKPDLPEFPNSAEENEKLSAHEIRQVRQLLKHFSTELKQTINKESRPALQDQPSTPPPSNTKHSTFENDSLKEKILNYFDRIKTENAEPEGTADSFKACLNEIDNEKVLIKAFAAIGGIFPVKSCLRHGTPEQKLFALIAIGDRFLQALSGEMFPARRKLLKTAASYLSNVSERFSFIQMENENFSMQYHERAPGSSNSGRKIREMTGFLVVEKSTNRVVRIGQVLT